MDSMVLNYTPGFDPAPQYDECGREISWFEKKYSLAALLLVVFVFAAIACVLSNKYSLNERAFIENMLDKELYYLHLEADNHLNRVVSSPSRYLDRMDVEFANVSYLEEVPAGTEYRYYYRDYQYEESGFDIVITLSFRMEISMPHYADIIIHYYNRLCGIPDHHGHYQGHGAINYTPFIYDSNGAEVTLAEAQKLELPILEEILCAFSGLYNAIYAETLPRTSL